jgi:hypothetical protein
MKERAAQINFARLLTDTNAMFLVHHFNTTKLIDWMNQLKPHIGPAWGPPMPRNGETSENII